MRVIKIDMPVDRAEYLVDAIVTAIDSFGPDMLEDEINALESIRMELKRQLNA